MKARKQLQISRTIPFLMVVCLLGFPAHARYGGGSGTAEDPYQIWTPEQMNAIGAEPGDWDKHFKLMTDIDLGSYTGEQFNIIGEDLPQRLPFSGTLDGNGHRILNFTYRCSGKDNIGLFGYVNRTSLTDRSPVIQGLALIDPNVDAGDGDSVGALIGLLFDGVVSRCYVQNGRVVGGFEVGGLVGGTASTSFPTAPAIEYCHTTCNVLGVRYVGGLIGRSDNTSLCDSYSGGEIRGPQSIGGLVGHGWSSSLSRCFSQARVFGDHRVAGLVGSYFGRGTITCCAALGSVRVTGQSEIGGVVGTTVYGALVSCYSAANVSGTSLVGGLVGAHQGIVSTCYASGPVEGQMQVGGLVGSLEPNSLFATGIVTQSFWDIETSGQTTSAGGEGRTTAQMHSASTFTDAGWDFIAEWMMPRRGGYPALWWEFAQLPPLPVFSGGAGTADDPYLISTAAELNSISHHPALMRGQFKLIDDIDLKGVQFLCLGNTDYPFAGVFDGNGHRIVSFGYEPAAPDLPANNMGLFRCVDGEETQVLNLRLVDCTIHAGTGNYVGALIGLLKNGTVSNCSAENVDISGESFIGGLVGSNSGNLVDCASSGKLWGYFRYVGGVAGVNLAQGRLDRCCSTGAVSAGGVAGGLAGLNEGKVNNSYSTCSATARDRTAAGLVGYNTETGTVDNCYCTGEVSATHFPTGGLAAENHGSIDDSFWDMETSGQITSAGGIGLSSVQMMDVQTYLAAGWDFVGETANGAEDLWWIVEGQDYPRLWWERQPGEDAGPEDQVAFRHRVD